MRRATRVAETLVPRQYQFLSTLSLRRATVWPGLLARPFFLISIHALLAESDWGRRGAVPVILIFLSTLSLRRATLWAWMGGLSCNDFYPRSPCGERLVGTSQVFQRIAFLSTLSLRRATTHPVTFFVCVIISIHALLAESDSEINTGGSKKMISIHALLAESDKTYLDNKTTQQVISIHALLAESDDNESAPDIPKEQFLSTLSLRRATIHAPSHSLYLHNISIHALLAESDLKTPCVRLSIDVFLSTLSLRRATNLPSSPMLRNEYFYPRSPCGERRDVIAEMTDAQSISIHALLAESDFKLLAKRLCDALFLSTLSLRRATWTAPSRLLRRSLFLSTLSLRRATLGRGEVV